MRVFLCQYISPSTPRISSTFGHHVDCKMRNLQLSHICRLTFNRNRLTQISNRFFVACAVAAFLIASFVATRSAAAGTLDDVRARDKLICGVSEGLPGFSEKDGSGVWRGFGVDFCKAVAAAVLGDTAKVEYVPLSADDRFDALKNRRIDLLSRNSTWTMSRDLELGVEFAGVIFFDGQGFLAPALLGATSPLQLNGAKICVGQDTTSESNAAAFFRKNNLKVTFLGFAGRTEVHDAYAAGKCD